MENQLQKFKRPVAIKIWAVWMFASLIYNAAMLLFGMGQMSLWWQMWHQMGTFALFASIAVTALNVIGAFRLFYFKYDAPKYILSAFVVGGILAVKGINFYEKLDSVTLFGALLGALLVIAIQIFFIVKFFEYRRSGILFDGDPRKHSKPSPEFSEPSNIQAPSNQNRETESQAPAGSANEAASQQAWRQVSDEVERNFIDKGLWARCFAESDGDEKKTKARYMQARQRIIWQDWQEGEVAKRLEYIKNIESSKRKQLGEESIEEQEWHQNKKGDTQKIEILKKSIRYKLQSDSIWKRALKNNGYDFDKAADWYLDYCIKNYSKSDYENIIRAINYKDKKITFVVIVAFILSIALVGFLISQKFNSYSSAEKLSSAEATAAPIPATDSSASTTEYITPTHIETTEPIGIAEESRANALPQPATLSTNAADNVSKLIEQVKSYKKQNRYDLAIPLLQQAAKLGNTDAQLELGFLYNMGEGVDRDPNKATHWYEKAAAQGNVDAQFNLGILYEKGDGVGQDYSKARQWYEKAAVQGDAQAQFNLGALYQNGRGVSQDYNKARQWYEKAAVKNDPKAQVNLGLLYKNGWGVKQNYTKARQWYEKAAAQGDASAQLGLGFLYAKGQGVKQNFDQAYQWFAQAAAQGDVDAKLNVGLSYAYGIGVPQNLDTAKMWLAQACSQGNQTGCDEYQKINH